MCFSQSCHCCPANGGGRPHALTKGVFVIWKKTQRAAAINVRPEVYYAITPWSHLLNRCGVELPWVGGIGGGTGDPGVGGSDGCTHSVLSTQHVCH